jgi:hypothetical protein
LNLQQQFCLTSLDFSFSHYFLSNQLFYTSAIYEKLSVILVVFKQDSTCFGHKALALITRYGKIIVATEVLSTNQRVRLRVHNVPKVGFASVSDKTARVGDHMLRRPLERASFSAWRS